MDLTKYEALAAKLKAAGIVDSERQGSCVCYHVTDKATIQLLELLPK